MAAGASKLVLAVLLSLLAAHGAAMEEPAEEPEEFEYIETPDMEVTGTARPRRQEESGLPPGAKVEILEPLNGHVYEDHRVIIRVDAHNVPEGEGFSGMLYFGAGNPFPISIDSLPVGITVTDLAPGNYSVKFLLLDPDRQPTGVDADVDFERRAPPGWLAPKEDNSRFDARIIQIATRFQLAESTDVLEDKNPFLDAFRDLAQHHSACTTCDAGGLSESDELLGQAIPLLLGAKGRNVAMGLDVLQHCADLGNSNCLVLALSLSGTEEREGLFGQDPHGDERARLEQCAVHDRSPLCRMALAFRLRFIAARGTAGLAAAEAGGPGARTAEACDAAALHYRLAADAALMFSQEDAGSGPLHSVRLLELTAVAAEQEKAVVEELRVVQAQQGNADAAAAVAIDRYFGTAYTGSGNKEEDKKSAAKLFHQARPECLL